MPVQRQSTRSSTSKTPVAVPWWPSKLVTLTEHHAWWAKNFGIEPEKLRYPGVHQYILDGGDHDIVIGLVKSLAVTGDQGPLLFFQGGYGQFTAL